MKEKGKRKPNEKEAEIKDDQKIYNLEDPVMIKVETKRAKRMDTPERPSKRRKKEEKCLLQKTSQRLRKKIFLMYLWTKLLPQDLLLMGIIKLREYLNFDRERMKTKLFQMDGKHFGTGLKEKIER